MQMMPCRFCGESSRLGVVTKWLGREGRVGAYARCKKCNARGPLVCLDGVRLDVRNERLSGEGKEHLIGMAVKTWNDGVKPDPMPLFEKEVRDGE